MSENTDTYTLAAQRLTEFMKGKITRKTPERFEILRVVCMIPGIFSIDEPAVTVRGMNRRVTDAEYDRVTAHALALGLNALIQEKEAAQEAYIPDFDMR